MMSSPERSESNRLWWYDPINRVREEVGDSDALPSVKIELSNVEIGPRRIGEYGEPFLFPLEKGMDYITNIGASSFDLKIGDSSPVGIRVEFRGWSTTVSMFNSMVMMEADFGASLLEDEVEAIFTTAEAEKAAAAKTEALASQVAPFVYEPPPFRVFLGHGGDDQWRVLRDQLRDDHGFEVKAFEGEPRAGYTIESVLGSMANESSVAVIVMTEADTMASGQMRARQNVVHEVGYFQGRLGWSNTIVLMEGQVEEFSNLAGTQHIKFPKGQIAASVGALVAALNKRKASR